MKQINWNRLKSWFLSEKRDLPWRENPSPYAVWVSEVMLQQTQVSVVIPYFEKWMMLFPSVEALAKAPLETVLKAWEGLGYYSRARNLHEGARYLCSYHSGQIPSDPSALAKIKGLGPYTIGAILSFAFHKKAAAVDGNVVRVLARYFMLEDDVSKPQTLKMIRGLMEKLLPNKEHWIINEGLIELGAKVCTKNPKCGLCPLKGSCMSFSHGVANLYPKKSVKSVVIPLYRTVTVITDANRWLVQKGKAGKIMADLYEFPYFEGTASSKINTIRQQIQHSLGLDVNYVADLKPVSHSFTKYRAFLSPFLFKSDSGNKPIEGFEWLSLDELSKVPFSSGHRRVFGQLE